MERISFAILILHISFSQASQAVSAVQAQRRNELKLPCSEKHADRTVWYGQKCNEHPFIIIAVIGTDRTQTDPIFIQGHDSRFELKWESNTASFGLTIKNFTDADQGFYYCSVGDGSYTMIASGYTVTLEEEVNTPTKPSVPANASVTLELRQENGHQHWQRQAIWPLVSLIVSGIALLGIYQIQKQPRRKKQTTHDEIKQHEGVYTTVYFTSC
ncbi:uncharacterized protein LOC118808404 isoform X2 [Colossoma macropomum]|uniref:uncharacterized protein LOC118808404 isoform X2 n=1 Tax=Colossoma macropomum TaxID=42526 RepID=UPI001865087B|nr:uncharacterized protein LOC118808404 isoform X2 [Colossoma macropomum]